MLYYFIKNFGLWQSLGFDITGGLDYAVFTEISEPEERMKWLSKKVAGWLRTYTADTLAMATYSALTFVPGFLFEWLGMRLSWGPIFGVKGAYVFIKYLVLAELSAWAISKLNKRLDERSCRWWKKVLYCGLVLAAVQLPPFGLCASFVWEPDVVRKLLSFYFCENMACGWIYRYFLRRFREWLVKPQDNQPAVLTAMF